MTCVKREETNNVCMYMRVFIKVCDKNQAFLIRQEKKEKKKERRENVKDDWALNTLLKGL